MTASKKSRSKTSRNPTCSPSVRDLANWLNTMTGKTYPVSAVLAIPGYSVIERAIKPIRVTNPKLLPGVLTAPINPVLLKDDIDLIRRQLEAKCRDVEC